MDSTARSTPSSERDCGQRASSDHAGEYRPKVHQSAFDDPWNASRNLHLRGPRRCDVDYSKNALNFVLRVILRALYHSSQPKQARRRMCACEACHQGLRTDYEMQTPPADAYLPTIVCGDCDEDVGERRK